MNENAVYYIWLSRAIPPGSATAKQLLIEFGSAKAIFEADEGTIKSVKASAGEKKALCSKDLTEAKKVLDWCFKNKVGILTYEDSYYPERLKLITNPPAMFYYKGRLKLFDDYPCITMVGTRSCSERGFRHAYECGFDAASKGAVIVNGLALGIDGACLAGALDANGYAVGILGCGIDRIYPYGNKEIFERLCASGLILTEFQPFSEPKGAHFPVRNRVLSGISLATVCFEAPKDSGALITAQHALDQGRRIFAVPGKAYDESFEGPLQLIKDGATVFTNANDVLLEYAMSFPHRINTQNQNPVPQDKLNLLVSKYFKNDINPDTPVNRKKSFSKKNGNAAVQNTSSIAENKNKHAENYASSHDIQKAVNTVAAKLNQRQMLDNLSSVLTDDKEKKQNTDKDNIQQPQPQKTSPDFLSPPEKNIYELMCRYGDMTADEIASHGSKIADVLTSLTIMEIYGIIKSMPGGKYTLNV